MVRRLARAVLRRPVREIPTLDELPPFIDSASYWESRYALGQNSGVGSYDDLAAFKAAVLNAFVAEHGIASVLELGCGDGNQLRLARYPSYRGFDVAPTAVRLCRKAFRRDRTKSFDVYDPAGFARLRPRAELTLSLDVVFHLVEEDVFVQHLNDLFDSAERFVCVYATNEGSPDIGDHVRHRRFTDWVQEHRPEWQVLRHVPNPHRGAVEGAVSDFWFFAPVRG
ncbi:MAG: glycosyl transferase group 1 [Frankiales bacterium]|jgi:SAM-dependent methyltransferase|nr:glycosyl transferase group 1 [Frankiales bacterium]